MQMYILCEDLALTPAQRATLIAGLRTLGPASDSQPCRLNHWRVRLDDAAVLFEADFQADTITAAAVRQRLAALFGVPLAQIGMATSTQRYGAAGPASGIAEYWHTGTPAVRRVRFVAFGGTSPTWEQSRDEVLAYLSANSAAWESSE